ncbi:WxL domain-containing protein [Lactococcus sp.]|uniref:WxL domain-containing protein n=1 Tax=Lactococcus sp. TaxID=44273 RepID=UPI0035AFFA54
MKTSRKVFSISATMLALVTLSTPVVSYAATASSPTGNASNVTQQVTDTATLTPGYLTIDGATNFDFGTKAIVPGLMTMNFDQGGNGVDTWTTGTAGVAATTNDQMTGNGSATAANINAAITATGTNGNNGASGSAEDALFTSSSAGSAVDGVQITDARGSNAGWTLYAYPSDLTNASGQYLLGSTIIIKTNQVVNTNTTLDPAGLNYPNNSTTTTAGANSTNYTLPTLTSSVTLQTGTGNTSAGTGSPNGSSAVQIATAAAGVSPKLSGTGTNDITYSSAKLNIPAGMALAGTFNGTITYDLTTAP